MLSRFIFACLAQDKSPDDPALRVQRLLRHSFSDFLDSLDNVSKFQLSKRPMHVCIVACAIEFLGLATNIQCLSVNHMNVEQESQIVVCIRVPVVHQNALLEMFDSMLVITDFKVSKA